jgi:hypothetical protein
MEDQLVIEDLKDQQEPLVVQDLVQVQDQEAHKEHKEQLVIKVPMDVSPVVYTLEVVERSLMVDYNNIKN